MKYIISLSLKYIKRQKFRTLLTYISVFLAAFVLTISLIIGNSLLKSYEKYLIEYKTGFEEVNLSQIFAGLPDQREGVRVLKNHSDVQDFVYFGSVNTYAASMDNVNTQTYDSSKNYIEINVDNQISISVPGIVQKYITGTITNETLTHKKCIEVKNEGGIVLPEIYKNYDYKIGDKIMLAITPVKDNARGKTVSGMYTIEGFSTLTDDSVFPVYTYYEDVMLKDLITLNQGFLSSSSMSNKTALSIKDDSKFWDAVSDIIKQIDPSKDKYDLYNDSNGFNKELLLIKGKALVDASFFLKYFVMLVVFIVALWLYTRLVIDNAFEISVTERNKKLNLLKIVGAQKKHIAALTLTEAVFYGITAVIPGIVCSYLFSGFIFGVLKKSGVPAIVFYVHPLLIAAAAVFCFISLIISAYTSAVLPTRKKTLAQAASYGASAGSKIPESKRKNAVLDKTPKQFISSFVRKNIGRTKGKFAFSVFACSVSTTVLVISVLFGLSVIEIVGQITEKETYPKDFTVSYLNTTLNDVYDDFSDKSVFSAVIPKTVSYCDINQIDDKSKAVVSRYFSETDNGAVYIIPVGRLEYEDKYEKYTNISYDDFSKSQNGIAMTTKMATSFSFNDNNEIQSVSGTIDTCFAPSLPNADSYVDFGNIKADILGILFKAEKIYVTIDEWMIVPEEMMNDIRCGVVNVSLTTSDKSDYDTAKALFREVIDNNDNIYEYEDCYLKSSGKTKFPKAVLCTFLVFAFLLWLASVITSVNLTNTRTMNSQREYFIMRCQGMTKKQINSSVFREVVLFTAISSIIGVLLGIGIYLSFLYSPDQTDIKEFNEIVLKMIIPAIGISAFSFITNILISTVCARPWIRRLYETSSDIVNSNEMR